MITIYPAASAHQFDLGWLKGSHVFSFGDFYDPENTAFGPMRVCNDDTIAPGKGFGAHPHSDMEIVSIVLSGVLRHEDNLGNVAQTSFGGIQRMSAGTGAIHTEHNPSDSEPVRLLQLWFMPKARGRLPPMQPDASIRPSEGRLLPVVAAEASEEIVDIAQDMTIYLGKAEAGGQLNFRQETGRRSFVYLVEGQLTLNGKDVLKPGDSARIEDTAQLELKADENILAMVIDLP